MTTRRFATSGIALTLLTGIAIFGARALVGGGEIVAPNPAAQSTDSPQPAVHGTGTPNYVAKFVAVHQIGDSVIYESDSYIGIGTTVPDSPLTVAGQIEATADGFKFPDATVQTTAVIGGGAGIPIGGIIMWSGLIASIPAGWQLCDGTNGTPDLRDRFILGTRAGEDPGEAGGAHSAQLTVQQMPWHQHGGWTSGYSHGHYYYAGSCSSSTTVAAGLGFDHADDTSCYWNQYYTITDFHNHSLLTDGQGGTTPVDKRPAYYRLAYIMRL